MKYLEAKSENWLWLGIVFINETTRKRHLLSLQLKQAAMVLINNSPKVRCVTVIKRSQTCLMVIKWNEVVILWELEIGTEWWQRVLLDKIRGATFWVWVPVDSS